MWVSRVDRAYEDLRGRSRHGISLWKVIWDWGMVSRGGVRGSRVELRSWQIKGDGDNECDDGGEESADERKGFERSEDLRRRIGPRPRGESSI